MDGPDEIPSPRPPRLILGDCLDVMRGMDSASVDAVCCDPPAGINFMQRAFDSDRGGRTQWVAWLAERMAEAARVIRPGHYALVWALPRTSHWTACALEDAGWTIIERIAHVFGTGFPKSKARLKPAVEDWWLCRAPGGGKVRELGIDACRVAIVGDIDPTRKRYNQPGNGAVGSGGVYNDGWAGDDVVPSVLHPDSVRHDARGRWPSNLVLTHSAACRPVGTRKVRTGIHVGRNSAGKEKFPSAYSGGLPESGTDRGYASPDGTETVEAWLCYDDCPVKALDEQAGERPGPWGSGKSESRTRSGIQHSGGRPIDNGLYRDSGGPSRFFPTFSYQPEDMVDLSCFSPTMKGEHGGQQCPEKPVQDGVSTSDPADGIASGASLEVGRSTLRPSPDGSGNNPTGPSPKGARYTTRISTRPITNCQTSNASRPNGTMTSTSDCGKTIESSMVSSIGGARTAENIGRSTSSTDARPGPIPGTASYAPSPISGNGDGPTASMSGPQDASGITDPSIRSDANSAGPNTSPGSSPNASVAIHVRRSTSNDPRDVEPRFFPTFAWSEADFFPLYYCPKASKFDRGEGNTHNTVKPQTLMRWLAKLITPENGTILDPFMGSGTTGLAALSEGFGFVGIESDPEYHRIAARRLATAAASTPLFSNAGT